MSEPPAKRKSFFDRMRSLPVRTWIVILAVESAVFLGLVALLLWVMLK